MNTKVRTQLSVMMFLEFFVWGSWYVAMGPYLGKINFSETAIGSAYSTTGWAAIISPFFVGMIADRFFSAEKVLGVLHIMGGILLFVAAQAGTPGVFFFVLLLHTLCYMPTISLVNAVSFTHMTDPGKEFPLIRVLGTIGWIAAGLTVSFVLPKITGTDNPEVTSLPMKLGAATAILLGIYCFFLPHTPPKAAGKKVKMGDILGLEALKLFKDKSFAIFAVSSFLICIPLSFYFAFAGKFLTDSGMGNVVGKMTLGQMSEIFFMVVMPFFFARLGVKKMLLTGMIFWVARYVLFAFGNNSSLVSMYYLAILFHGICYDFFFVTGQIYVDKKADEKIRASAQGLIAFITLGAGMVIGTLLSGKVAGYFTSVNEVGEKVSNWKGIWLTPAIMAAVVVVIFMLSFKENAVGAEAATTDDSNNSQ